VVSGGVGAAAATPQVTIPNNFSPVRDERLGYSFAIPGGWTELNLRSQQFQTLAATFGLGEQLGPLLEFLDTPQGQALGKIYVTDLTSAIFGGFPTILAVVVVDAPDQTPQQARQAVEALIQANSAMLGDVEIGVLEATTVNNLPAVHGAATANAAAVGIDAELFGKVVGLLANDRLYVMTLLTHEGWRTSKEPVFDQIIGTFRPE
jgi:hypothetical protein